MSSVDKKPKFEPDPPPDVTGLDELEALRAYTQWNQAQFDRAADWWPRENESRLNRLEQFVPALGTWPIVDYSYVNLTLKEAGLTCVAAVDCDANAQSWPTDLALGGISKPFVMSNVKFKNPVSDTAVYAMYFTDDGGVGGSPPWHGFWLQYCDIDLKDIGVTTAYFGQFTFPASLARVLNEATHNSEKNYLNVARTASRISLTRDEVTTPTAGYGTNGYAGGFPVPTYNVVNVSPGVDTFRDAIAAANNGDNLVLSPGTYSHSVDGTGYTPNINVTKNIRIYGATSDPNDVIITMSGGVNGWLQYRNTTIPCVDDPCGNSIAPGIFHVTLQPQATGSPSTWAMIQLRAEL
jgi:hypothetical protein